MTKSEAKTIKKEISIAISFLLALIFIEIYNYKPVNDYIYAKFTTSNIIPYALFIIIYCVVMCISINILSEKICQKISGSSKIVSYLVTIILVVTAAGLLIECYLNEVNVFDGPTADTMLYHSNEYVTVLAMLAMFVVSLIIVSSYGPDIKIKGLIYCFAVIVGIIYAYSFYLPNVFSASYDIYHFNAYFNSIYSALKGVPRSGLNTGVYGYYGLLLAPFLKIIGGGLSTFMIILAGLAFISYMGIVYVIVELVDNNAVRLFAIGSLVVINCSIHTGIYFQLVPHRILFAGILLAYLLFGIKKNLLKKKIYMAVGIILLILSVIWNFETGIVYVAGIVAYFIIGILKNNNFKQYQLYLKCVLAVAALAGIIVCAWIATGLLNMIYGGDFITVKQFIFPLMNSAYFDYLRCEYQKGVVAWLVVAFFALYYVGNAIYNTSLNKKGATEGWKDMFMCSVAVIALGQMTYYINRTAYGNLSIVHMTAMVLIAVFCDECISKARGSQSLIVKCVSKGMAAVSLSILMAYVFAGVFNYSFVQQRNDDAQLRDTESYNAQIQQIGQACPANTKAIGFMIPMVYYELGWDSGIYLIDFADLDVYPESLQYLENMLDNLDEPILIDSLGIETMEDKGVDLTAFYSRYEVTDEFKVGSVVIQYWNKK